MSIPEVTLADVHAVLVEIRELLTPPVEQPITQNFPVPMISGRTGEQIPIDLP